MIFMLCDVIAENHGCWYAILFMNHNDNLSGDIIACLGDKLSELKIED